MAISLGVVFLGAASVGIADEIGQPVAAAVVETAEPTALGVTASGGMPAAFQQAADPFTGSLVRGQSVAFKPQVSSAEDFVIPNDQQNRADASRFVGSY
ncbi:MAG: hypothetical protein P8L85_23250 [Rubripirellula sp.]|nr:hypothetical protein [Rubripirellula sp.]